MVQQLCVTEAITHTFWDDLSQFCKTKYYNDNKGTLIVYKYNTFLLLHIYSQNKYVVHFVYDINKNKYER
jgi:hypothetical protein